MTRPVVIGPRKTNLISRASFWRTQHDTMEVVMAENTVSLEELRNLIRKPADENNSKEIVNLPVAEDGQVDLNALRSNK